MKALYNKVFYRLMGSNNLKRGILYGYIVLAIVGVCRDLSEKMNNVC